jgi:hypothetical protein
MALDKNMSGSTAQLLWRQQQHARNERLLMLQQGDDDGVSASREMSRRMRSRTRVYTETETDRYCYSSAGAGEGIDSLIAGQRDQWHRADVMMMSTTRERTTTRRWDG